MGISNRDWLFSLPLEEQYAWMNAEHQDGTEAEYGKGGMVGGSFCDTPEQGEVAMPLESWREYLDTASENEDSRELLEADVRNFAEKSGWLYPMAGTRIVLEWLDRQAAITERETKLRELYKFEENHREHIRSLEEVNRKLNERIAELQSQSDEKWNLYVAERGRADRLATDLGRCGVERETFRETTTVLMDSITEGLREVNAILDGKDEGLA